MIWDVGVPNDAELEPNHCLASRDRNASQGSCLALNNGFSSKLRVGFWNGEISIFGDFRQSSAVSFLTLEMVQ